MKKFLVALLVLWIFTQQKSFAQESDFTPYTYPPVMDTFGKTYYCGRPIEEVAKVAELIIEGRILTDTVYFSNPVILTKHRVQVLKLFKGDISSDTITIVTGGGVMEINTAMRGGQPYSKIGDEALIIASKYHGVYQELYGNGCGYVLSCNRKDIDRLVYKPLEKALGNSYKVLHPKVCFSPARNQKK